jgi:membrane associated rhomboid family serine protease
MIPLRDTNPSERRPLVVTALLLANAAVFLFELMLSSSGLESLFQEFGVIPARLSDPGHWSAGAWRSLFTYMFLHGGWLHVIGNLWILWIFGDNVEDRMGHFRFLIFYVIAGVAAALTQTMLTPGSRIPSVGASGAIAGVMGAYLVMFPGARVLTMVPILFYPVFLELPAVTFLGLWFVLQLFSGTLSLGARNDAAGIAFWAHVGGFLAGVLLHRLFVRRRARRARWSE